MLNIEHDQSSQNDRQKQEEGNGYAHGSAGVFFFALADLLADEYRRTHCQARNRVGDDTQQLRTRRDSRNIGAGRKLTDNQKVNRTVQ